MILLDRGYNPQSLLEVWPVSVIESRAHLL